MRYRLSILVLVVACSGGKSSTPPPTDPGTVQPPVTNVPENAGEIPIARVALECEVTHSAVPCDKAKAKSMSVAVTKVNNCRIDRRQAELRMILDNTATTVDTIKVTVPGIPAQGSISGSYPIATADQVHVTDGGNADARNGAVPDTRTGACTAACNANITETAPGGVPHVAVDLQCTELCVPNECLRCKVKGTGDVRFKLAASCP